MLSKAQGMYLADEAFIFQYSRWRWLSRWLWLNSLWIPVVLIALFGSVEEIEIEKDSGVSCFRDDSGGRWRIPVYRRMCTGLDLEAVKAMEAWATRGYSVVGVKHVVDIRCRFFFGLPVVGLWMWISFGLGFCLGFPMLVT
ncbi:hypothetical protein F2Q70_00024312 [Brassica cretica]|uniref:Uncharacterized protein n=1 Tax=Brassica cretica TaxID=69181 RepID=A0A8S9L9A3_BRACR|nr:hypothetical protein F2Q70_00024312 [Brassica cretica]KAF3581476.1 hypothetical protein DY000_02028346 [Brassica cretica]